MKPKKSNALGAEFAMPRVMAYGLLQPIENADILDGQLRLAGRLFNDWVKLERLHREQVLAAKRAIDGLGQALSDLEAAEELTRAAWAAREDAKDADAGQDELDRLDEQLDEAREVEREARRVSKEQEAAAAEVLDPIKAELKTSTHEEHNRLRRESGVYWGTYNRMDAAFDQAVKMGDNPYKSDGSRKRHMPPWERRPHFRPNRDKPAGVKVQCMPPIPVSEIFRKERKNCVAWIDPLPPDAFDPALPKAARKRLQRTKLYIKICSEERKPVYAVWPLFLHRPLPVEGMITGIEVIRRPWGQRWEYRWKVCISVALRSPAIRPGAGTVAVNIGWRRVEGGDLRVATWSDNQGDSGHLILPFKAFRDRLHKQNEIQKTRDDRRNELAPQLRALGVDCSIKMSPRSFRKILEKLDATPRELRGPNHAAIVAILRPWIYRDKHLEWYQRGLREGALLYRRDAYRRLALELATRYPRIIVEDYNMISLVEDPSRLRGPAYQRVQGAPSVLREALHSVATRLGCTDIPGKSKLATQQCALCGCKTPWDAAPRILHTCEGCGETWDQDINNTRNMLAWAQEGLTDETLASLRPSTTRKPGGRHQRGKAAAAEAKAAKAAANPAKGESDA